MHVRLGIFLRRMIPQLHGLSGIDLEQAEVDGRCSRRRVCGATLFLLNFDVLLCYRTREASRDARKNPVAAATERVPELVVLPFSRRSQKPGPAETTKRAGSPGFARGRAALAFAAIP